MEIFMDKILHAETEYESALLREAEEAFKAVW